MGLFDFNKDAGDTEVMDRKGLSEDQLKELQTSNTVIRKILGAKLPIEGLKADFDNGVVVLKGKVPDQATREKAVLLAGNTPGVAKVDDRLETGSPGTAAGLYTVKKGDTLSAIAQRELGSASRFKEIFEANRPMLADPDKIYPGQVLRIPQE